jgi:energy-coupling factor transporter ATP-binding protein EcfA2
MGKVGLSDAFVYLKRFDELSNGQQYRAMLAQLLLGGCNVWIADEFCSNLDPLTANVVAARIQAAAREVGAALVTASSQPEPIIASLRPDKVIRLGSGRENEVLGGQDFIRMFKVATTRFSPPSLRVPHAVVSAARKMPLGGITVATGSRVEPGLLLLESESGSEVVRVVTSDRVKADEVPSARKGTARESSRRLKRSVPRLYSTTQAKTGWVTVLRVAPLC